jgi:hypothetical protein
MAGSSLVTPGHKDVGGSWTPARTLGGPIVPTTDCHPHQGQRGSKGTVRASCCWLLVRSPDARPGAVPGGSNPHRQSGLGPESLRPFSPRNHMGEYGCLSLESGLPFDRPSAVSCADRPLLRPLHGQHSGARADAMEAAPRRRGRERGLRRRACRNIPTRPSSAGSRARLPPERP